MTNPYMDWEYVNVEEIPDEDVKPVLDAILRYMHVRLARKQTPEFTEYHVREELD